MLLEILTKKQPTNDLFVGYISLHNWVNLAFWNKVKEVADFILFLMI
jgi:hypothetical protein